MLRGLGVLLRGLRLLLGLGLPLLELLVGLRLGLGALLLDLLVGGSARFGDRCSTRRVSSRFELRDPRRLLSATRLRVVGALLGLLGGLQRLLLGLLRALGGRAGALHPGLDRVAHRSGIHRRRL